MMSHSILEGGQRPDAPSDGQQYARKNSAWDVVVAGAGSSYAEAANFAALPAAASNTGITYLVRAAQGVLFVNRKSAGLYRSDGATWVHLVDETEAYFQDTLAWTNITSKPATFAPSAHATNHQTGGSDAIALDTLAAPTDVTTLNASTTAHGLAPKATAPAAGLLSVLGIGNGETVRSDKAIFDTTNPANLGTAGPGTALVAARRDHIHQRQTAIVTAEISDAQVTLAKQADMATASVLYRKTAGTGVPEVQSLATLKTDLGLTGTNSGDQTITLTGDVTGGGTGSFAATLATVNSNLGTFGSATKASVVTVNAKGLVTAASESTVTPAVGSVTGLGTGIATALGVNVGTAGAPVVNGGVLGTPSSGTGTNLTGIPEGGLSLTDITTNNASTTKHGFLKKLSNVSTEFMDGTGAWSTPVGTGGADARTVLRAKLAFLSTN